MSILGKQCSFTFAVSLLGVPRIANCELDNVVPLTERLGYELPPKLCRAHCIPIQAAFTDDSHVEIYKLFITASYA